MKKSQIKYETVSIARTWKQWQMEMSLKFTYNIRLYTLKCNILLMV